MISVRHNKRLLRRLGFTGDQKGVAAVEFALIFPVMMVLYLGSVELLQGISINRQVALTATTVASIVSQYTSISASTQMPDILNASVQILTPNPPAHATVIISCLTIDNAGHATVTWSQAFNTAPRPNGQAIAVPNALDVPNTTLLFSEATYAYTPLLDFIHVGTSNLHSSTYMAPRASTTINLVP